MIETGMVSGRMRARLQVFAALVALAVVPLLSCATPQGGELIPERHPPLYELGERRVFCSKCHAGDEEPLVFEKYNHTAFFTEGHRLVALQDEAVCAMCHAQSFCNDCHVTPSSELKPSLRHQTSNYRRFQHRGDYVSRHRIDGRVDPAPCFRCHGNPRSAESCQPCHG